MGKNTCTLKVTTPRLTHHGAETPKLEYIAPRPTEVKKTIDDLSRTITAAMMKEQDEASELEKAKRKMRDLEEEVKELKAKVNIKMSVKEMMGNGDEALQAKILQLSDEIETLKKGQEESINAADLNGYSRGRADSEAELEEKNNIIEKLEGENKAFAEFKTALAKVVSSSSIQTASANTTAELQKVITIVPLESVKRILPKLLTTTVKGKILTAAKDGYFSEWHSIADLSKHLIETYRWNCGSQQLNKNLGELVKSEIIGFRRDEQKQLLEYKLAVNVIFTEESKQ
jgi:hypothetical protein